MTISITHTFVSGIADDPAAAAKGEVLPSHWNAGHVITGLGESLIQITANTDYYVSTTGNDTNDGLTSGTAWLTIARALDYLNNSIDVAITGGMGVITLNIGVGTFTGGAFTYVFDNFNGNTLVINGAGSNTIVGNQLQFVGFTLSPITISNMTIFTDTELNSGMLIVNGVMINITNVAFAQSGGPFNSTSCIQSTISGSNIFVTFCTISASISMGYFIFVDDHVGCYITISHLTFSAAFFFWTVLNVGDDVHLTDKGNNTDVGVTGSRFSCKGRMHFTGSYAPSNNIQVGVGNFNGSIIEPGQIESSDGIWHGYVAGIISDTANNIITFSQFGFSNPTPNLIGFATDQNQLFISDTSGNWWLLDGYLTQQGNNQDIGYIQFSNRIGYGKDYITDKSLANCSIGFGSIANPVDGQLRHFLNSFFNTEVLQIYQNNEWETLPSNITLRDNQSTQNHALEHFPLTNTWIRTFSGDSEMVGLNGRSIVQGYQVDLGSYPGIQQLNGGTF